MAGLDLVPTSHTAAPRGQDPDIEPDANFKTIPVSVPGRSSLDAFHDHPRDALQPTESGRAHAESAAVGAEFRRVWSGCSVARSRLGVWTHQQLQQNLLSSVLLPFPGEPAPGPTA